MLNKAMIQLHADQLNVQLQESLYPCYLLFGNDPLLLQESLDDIRHRAQEQHFNEHFSIALDTVTDWDTIFNLCQARSLFSTRQTLLLVLPDGGLKISMEEKLLHMVSLLHRDLLLILCGNKLTPSLKKTTLLQVLMKIAVLVNCATPEKEKLLRWVTKRAKNMKLVLNELACQSLCYYYEGNLLALTQALERLSLIYPDGNLTLLRVNAAIHNAAHFTSSHLIDAMLTGESKRAAHILHHLQLEDIEPVILLRNIQREVLQLLTLKRQLTVTPIHILFDRYKVWQSRRSLLAQALGRLTISQLQDSVTLMSHIELTLKQNYSYPVWPDFNALMLLLCGKILPEVMLGG